MTVEYKTYPYQFSGLNGATIAGIIRQYNHMNMNEDVLKVLVSEFTKINPEAKPPKMGQTVQIPVLLPFCGKHNNDEHEQSIPTGINNIFGGPLNT